MQNENTPSSEDAILRHAITQPNVLDHACREATIELMIDLAAGNLTGEAIRLAQQLRNEDRDARELYALLTSLPIPKEKTAPLASALQQLIDGLTDALREFYSGLAQTALLAEGEQEISEETILVQGTPCILRRDKRPDGQYDVALVIPAGVSIDPADLTNLELKIVNKPQRLIFQRFSSGDLVATYVLPATVADPNKQIVVVTRSTKVDPVN